MLSFRRWHLGPGLTLVCAGCGSGARPSAMAALQILGVETISVGNVFRGSFTPDGDTLYYFKNVTEGQEDYRIFRSYRTGDAWSTPERVRLGGEHSDMYPAITPDGRRMVFSSYRPAPGDTSAHPSAYLWYVERQDGGWSRPVFMAEANAFSHYHSQPIFDGLANLYFARQTWDYRNRSEHMTRWENGRYTRPDTSTSWIALRDRAGPGRFLYETTPGYDGSFSLLVIGARPDSGRSGPPDLYVSFRNGAEWSAPKRLEYGISTSGTENFAFYGPGGRELYFVRDFARIYHLPLDKALATR